MVERSAVNRLVVGSNPTAGANGRALKVWLLCYLQETVRQWFKPTTEVVNHQKNIVRTARRGIAYAVIRIMFFTIIAGALTLSSAVTLAVLARRAPEAYETERGLQVVHRIPKRRASAELSEALVQAR